MQDWSRPRTLRGLGIRYGVYSTPTCLCSTSQPSERREIMRTEPSNKPVCKRPTYNQKSKARQ